MTTYRCRECGQVLAAFVSGIPGLALPFSAAAALSAVDARRTEHIERCPARALRAG